MKPALVALLSVTLAASGCSTMRYATPEDIEAEAHAQIRGGEHARVVLRSGEVRRMRIRAMDNATLSGEEGHGASAHSVQIALADVQSMTVRRGDGLRTAAIVVGVAVGVAAVAVGGLLVAQCGIKLDDCGD